MKKKCPCCDFPQTLFSLKGQRIMLPCEKKENYKCLHCIACNNQIGTPIHVLMYHFFSIAKLVISWFIARLIREYFGLWIEYTNIFFDTPIMLIVYIVLESLIWKLINLKCIMIDNENLKLDDNPMLTTIEKKSINFSINFMLLVQIFLIAVLFIGIFISLLID